MKLLHKIIKNCGECPYCCYSSNAFMEFYCTHSNFEISIKGCIEQNEIKTIDKKCELPDYKKDCKPYHSRKLKNSCATCIHHLDITRDEENRTISISRCIYNCEDTPINLCPIILAPNKQNCKNFHHGIITKEI